jgi:predicted amidohydrolase YtcJ
VPDGDEVVFHGGTVFDGARFLPEGTCVRVRGGKITEIIPPGAAGAASGAGWASPAGPAGSAELVNLQGGTLLPGFIDAHAHPVFAGDQLRHCDLRGAATAAGYVELVAAYARDHPAEEWITGGGWSMDAFPGGVPSRDLLDAVVPDRPVFLPNRDGHGAWVNTRALTMAGISRSTPDPADGRIERDASGEPVGMLQEGAANIVARLLPEVTEDDWYQALLAAQDHLFSLGITGWQDAIVGSYQGAADPFNAYLRAAETGTLRATVVGALWWDRASGLEQLEGLVHRRSAARVGRFRATRVKMMLDGVAENHTAAMLEPYLDGHGCATGNSGLDFIDPAELPRYVTALDAEGFGVHFHALGDRAVRNALDAVAAARQARTGGREENGGGRGGAGGPRHHLAHLQVVHPDDIPRFAQLSATANIQPLWATHEPQMDELTIPFLGERRSGWQYPFGSLQAAGASLCAGSDWPVSSPNPLWAAHVAVNRIVPPADQGDAGHGPEPFLPEQRLGLTTFLAAYTSGSAWINGAEETAGAIREGLGADFAIVDADLSAIEDPEIGAATVTQTWIRGELRYQHGQP